MRPPWEALLRSLLLVTFVVPLLATDVLPVQHVIDGDTIVVGRVGRVRLLGIDAPELGLGFDTAAPFAQESRDFLANLLVGRYVRLEMDGERADRYGRRLAYVYREDGPFINAEMLRAGLARISARRNLRRLPELRAAEHAARISGKGMWSGQRAH